MRSFSVIPSVTTLSSDLWVAWLTKGHQVTGFIAASFGEREDVVDFFSSFNSSVLITLLAKRMGFDVAIPDTLPGPTVAFIGRRISLVLVVAFCYHLLMLGAVLSAVCKPTAAWVSTRTFRFVWHGFTSFGHKKSPRGVFPWRLVYIVAHFIYKHTS